MVKKPFSIFKKREILEGPIETGQTFGMNPETVLEKYFDNRNVILSLLRVYSNIPVSDVSKQLGISEEELKKIEGRNGLVPFQLVPKFAKVFNVDLKALLVLLGHAKGQVVNKRYREFNETPMAAQYSGPELTKQEKVDLKELIGIVLSKFQEKQK